jgi:hypothetical protein
MNCGKRRVIRRRSIRLGEGRGSSEPNLALESRSLDFTADNDPHGEHDFGRFTLVGRKFFWNIDYYDERCELGSETSDLEKTTRVLTIMLAEEYSPPIATQRAETLAEQECRSAYRLKSLTIV